MVAEGVENEEIFTRLRSLDCDLAQGDFFASAMSLNQLRGWLKTSQWSQPVDPKVSLEAGTTFRDFDAPWEDLEYHNPALSGQVIFNYSNNDGQYSIGRDEFFFETKWSKGSDRSIYLVSDPPSILGIAEAPKLLSYMDVSDPGAYDMSSRVRTIQKGEHAILKNQHSKYAVLKVLDIKDRTRSDSIDELTFEFWILTDQL